ncbi:MAG: hypothetical protein LBT59_29450 [Clostridiales bacterium]|jgi:tetratricopeptide (TPR) repeat protein|nr:hypothetical protein [Clostridiales bacterium]
MLEEIRIKAEQYCAQSINCCTEGNYDIALEMLNEGQALLNKDSNDIDERRLYFKFLVDRHITLDESNNPPDARIAAKEAINYYEKFPDEDDILVQAAHDSHVARMHAYLGNFSKAIHYADKVDIDSPRIHTSYAISIFWTLSHAYPRNYIGYDHDRFKKILVFIKDVLESVRLRIDYNNPQNIKDFIPPRSTEHSEENSEHDLEFSIDNLMEMYYELESIDFEHSRLSSALSWSEKGWALSQEVGLENCNASRLHSICFSALTYGSKLDDSGIKWCFRVIDCLKAMVAQGQMSLIMALTFAAVHNQIFLANPSNDFIQIDPLIFLEPIENAASADIFFAAREYWLCGFWLSRSNSWSTTRGKKAYRLLRKALRALTLQNAQNAVYAHGLALSLTLTWPRGKSTWLLRNSRRRSASCQSCMERIMFCQNSIRLGWQRPWLSSKRLCPILQRVFRCHKKIAALFIQAVGAHE